MILITQMTRCPLPDQRRFIDRPQFALQKATSACKIPRPVQDPFMAGSTHHGHQITGANNTKSLLLFLLSVTNFDHFPENSLLF
jgi:hypothetical protein